MENVTVSSDVDTLMQAADKAAIRSAIGLASVGSSEAIGWADAAITRNAAGRVGTPALSLSQGTITAAAAIIDAAGTWNNAGVTFTGIKANITDTASNASSLLLDLQVGGTSRISIAKNGRVVSEGQFSASAVITGGYAYTSTAANAFRSDASGAALVSYGWCFAASNRLKWSSTVNWYDSADLDVGRDGAANTWGQRNGTNAQTFRLYNTYTDGSNYERGFMRWSSNVLEIGTEAGGTGTLRSMRVGSSSRFRWINDGFRPKFNYAGVDTMEFGNNSLVLDDVGHLQWASADISTTDSATAVDTGVLRRIASVVGVTNGSTGGGAIGMREMTAPAAPATNDVYIYAEDNGSGKTRLMARFATGAAQQIAIEP